MQFLWDLFINEEDSVLFFIFFIYPFWWIKEQNQETTDYIEGLFEIVIAVAV